MKKIIKIILVSILCAITLIVIGELVQIKAQMEQDKQTHFAFGTFTGFSTSAIVWNKTGNRWLSVGVGTISSILIGTLKECYDNSKSGKHFSVNDLLATSQGGMMGVFSFHIILGNKSIHKSKVPKELIIDNYYTKY